MLPLVLVFSLWVIELCDPHTWLVAHGVRLAPLVQLAIYGLLAACLLIQAPPLSRWYVPFLLYVGTACVMIPFAENTGDARHFVLKILVLYYVLAVGSLTFIKTVKHVRLLLLLFLFQFPWWILQARFTDPSVGQTTWQPIPWHPHLGNTDAFGPLMVIGMAYAFYYGLAVGQPRARWLAFLVAGLCVVGMVAAYTRGASLAAGVIVVYVWLRSPHKRKTFGPLVLAAAAFMIATSLLYSDGRFWARLATITSEGIQTGTGAARWELWQMAWNVFLERPLFGVGAGNFGSFAFHHLSPHELVGEYQTNQWLVWGRALHNIYIQVLSEFGLVGAVMLVWLLVDFWRRNRALRTAPFLIAWQRTTPQGPDLRFISLGLEAALVAFLITGIFYDQLYVHWLYSLLTLNAVVYAAARAAAPVQEPPRPTRG